jgi:diguanylate cyclase (GGDEF)-like protein
MTLVQAIRAEHMFEEATPRLLAIDDSELIHRLLEVRLRGEGLELHSALSATDGLRMAREIRPDVILLDITLGEMDGFEVLQRLKQDPETSEIIVIFISANSDTMDRVRGLELGAMDFITKPFEVVELKARIKVALRIKYLMGMLEQKAQIDGLTGLWNRRYLDQRLHQEFTEGLRHGRSLSLIMCDIDRFKRLNDHYGHPFGDAVLSRLARILSGGRGSDIVCRYGGEEFTVILPSTPLPRALEVAERYRQSLEAETWPGHPDLIITGSFGVADLQMLGPKSRMEDLVVLADKALQRAKGSGRNRVEAAHSQA